MRSFSFLSQSPKQPSFHPQQKMWRSQGFTLRKQQPFFCLPRQSAGEVADWARQQFQHEVEKDNENINLTKACMLIALEEEAAEAVRGRSFSRTNTEQYQRVFFPAGTRDHGQASTWSLSRLDALTAEIRTAFRSRCTLPLPISQSSDAEKSAEDDPTSISTDLESASTGSGSTQDTFLLSDSELADRMQLFPVHSFEGVNRVLFERHGYRRMEHHGDPRDAQLHRVLETGSGCPAALAILYMEVCARLGLKLGARVLDQGRYFVLWPMQQDYLVDGQQVVIDAYSQGVAILADEVCQLFDLGPDTASSSLLQPSTPQEILAALLGVLRDSHWCQAAGCRPEPAYMIPISLKTACRADLRVLDLEHDLQRAIAAAERRAMLLPNSGEAYIQLSVLLYFAGEYTSAKMLIDVSMDLLQSEDAGLLTTYRNKLKLLVNYEL